MSIRHVLSSASALALLTSPALADVTASEIWAEMQDIVARYGATIETASVDEGGDRIAVEGATVVFDLPEDGSMTMDLGDMTFTETGDGRVEVGMSETMNLSALIPSPEGEGALSMTVSQTGLSLIVSGDEAERTYSSTADSISIGDVSITDPTAEEDVDITVDVTMSGLEGTSTISGEDLLKIVADSRADRIDGSIQASGTDEEGNPGSVDLRLEVSDYTATSDSTFTSFDMEQSLAKAVEAGFQVSGDATFGASSYSLEGEGVDGPFNISGTAQNSAIAVSLGEDGIEYDISNGPQSFTVTGGDVPFPLSMSLDEAAFRLALPIVPGEAAQDFALVSRTVGLTIDETLWNMFDPSEQVPREPATVIIDLSGQAVLTEDIFDPAYAEAPPAGPPGAVETVSLNELRVELAGGELTGDGEFTFPENMMPPQPTGTVNLMLKGGNRLIDTAVAMGLLPQEQAMGARMMLGLFARPAEGEDTLVSTIEFKEDGSIFANGQRIK